MSRTYDAGSCRVHYNGDFSGYVTIEHRTDPKQGTLVVPIDDLFDFIAHAVMMMKVQELEQATWPELLGVNR